MNKKSIIAIVVMAVLGIVIIAVAQNLSQYPPPSSIPQSFAWMGGIPVDPCATSAIAKSSVPINITTATTTSLVAVSGTTSVYVCGLSLTISQVVTTPNTIQFEYGTGASCTSPTVLTGLYGGGGVTAAAPILVTEGAVGTLFKVPSANGLCALTAIGATGSFQGVLSFVQQ